MNTERTPGGRRPLPIRWRDRLLVPPAPRDTAVITGHRARTPERRIVEVPDPVSGRATPIAVWHYATEPRQGAEGPTTPVVMIHGFRGDHHGLALLADCLPEMEFYLPELPGFGHSPAFPDAEHTVAHYATAVAAAVQTLGLVPIPATGRPATAPEAAARPVLLGHSFGSVVASHLAAEQPSRWRELILVNPICEPALSADGTRSERTLARLAQGYYAASAALPESLGMALLSSPVVVWFTGTVMAKTQDRHTLAYLHDQHQRYFSAFDHRRVLVESYRASIRGTVLDVADRLALPVLLVAGAQDELGSVAGQERLARRIREVSPRVRLEVFDGVGHLIHYERAPETAGVMRDFLRTD
ncbi:alpha/beta fold hydrolase [Citricoccus zhacaiensis]|uniref:alpha/beta fold hydrolase n=2 Tax=Citricoccus TaxID=169133 RepID=UPI003CEBC621